MWLLVSAIVFVVLILGRYKNDSILDPILWKWCVRLIWLGSIVFFQLYELQRYHEGLSYRPFFGLYVGVLFALLFRFLAGAVRSIGRRGREAARETVRSPLYWASVVLFALLAGLVLSIGHIRHQAPVPALLWFAALAIIVALLFVNRAMKVRDLG